MCTSCDTLATEALALATLRHAERRLILAESDASESVPHAIRPLSAAEKRAKMRFGEIEKLTSAAVEKATKLLTSNAQLYVIAVIGEIFDGRDTAEPAQVIEAFERLNRSQPKAVTAESSRAVEIMTTILGQVFTGSSLIAVGEAKRQGTAIDAVTPEADRFFDLARMVALHPWTRIISKLQTELLTPRSLAGPVKRADVEKIAKAIPVDGAVDLARQAVNTAHGAGRYETIAPHEPSEIVASELLDGATCSACEKVDGKEYATMADALVEYSTGGYGACKGGARCRGTLVVIY